ncbi:probable transcriptional regulator SLK2 [Salvia miltiorrhiza]|uniref:probable transcriptional regulator SLK2 n=1 Tax=Salvia miltiorrhiza TaxID=226208 RepID=UPI0025AC6728|nr:probable transcriptional regulator SLK2 [Salvia miltiorrhiza]
MALDAFLDSGSLPMALPVNGAEGILEALISDSSLKNEEHFGYILSLVQINQNPGSNIQNSTILGRSSTSRIGIGHDAAVAVANPTLPAGTYLQSHSNTTLEPYISLPVSFPSDDGLVNVSYNCDIFSQLCRAREEESNKQKLEGAVGSTDLCKTKRQCNQNSVPARMQREPGILAPVLKKPRLHVGQGNIQQQQQQESIQELLLKELDCNPQLKKQLPKQKMRILLHDQGNQQETSAPLLDGGICSRRLKQYLYHMRSNTHDNGISYWKKFVSEYYAPGSKKSWCFSKYGNIKLQTAGVFCPKSMGTYGCQICGLKSGKGLEATSETFPRLFKMKFESGMLDEILYIDSPRAHKVHNGLVLEYGKAIQASVYETFRVVHNGKLRVVFGNDLKILSWEFCIENHEEYLLQTLFTPQVKQLVQAVEKYQDIQNCVSSRASLLDLQRVCDMCVSAGIQTVRNMELPLVNDLGYPKRFIRCLQISEVVDSMKDLMAFSQDTKLGAIECLNNYSRGRNIHHQGTLLPVDDDQNSPVLYTNGCSMSENGVVSGLKSLGLAFIGQNSSTIMAFEQSFDSHFHKEVAATYLPRSQASERGQASVDKMLLEMLAASRGRIVQDSHKRPDDDQTCATSKKPRCSEGSNAATAQHLYGHCLLRERFFATKSAVISPTTNGVYRHRIYREAAFCVRAVDLCHRELELGGVAGSEHDKIANVIVDPSPRLSQVVLLLIPAVDVLEAAAPQPLAQLQAEEETVFSCWEWEVNVPINLKPPYVLEICY